MKTMRSIKSFYEDWSGLAFTSITILVIGSFLNIGVVGINSHEYIIPNNRKEEARRYIDERMEWYVDKGANIYRAKEGAKEDASEVYGLEKKIEFLNPYYSTLVSLAVFFMLIPLFHWSLQYVKPYIDKKREAMEHKKKIDREFYVKQKELELKLMDPNYDPLKEKDIDL